MLSHLFTKPRRVAIDYACLKSPERPRYADAPENKKGYILDCVSDFVPSQSEDERISNRSTGLNPSSLIPLCSTCLAASYSAILAFMTSGSLPMTLRTS